MLIDQLSPQWLASKTRQLVLQMAANFAYLLAVGFLISSSLLFMLCCRHLWLRRRQAEEDSAGWDVRNLQQTRAEGAPSFIIARLPVVKYNPKVIFGCNRPDAVVAYVILVEFPAG